MDKIVLWIYVFEDDWTEEMVIIVVQMSELLVNA